MTVPSTGDTQRAPGKSGNGVAEDHREHAGQRHRRDREHQHHPEQPPELRDVVPMTAVTAMALVTLVACFGVVLRVVDLSHARNYTP